MYAASIMSRPELMNPGGSERFCRNYGALDADSSKDGLAKREDFQYISSCAIGTGTGDNV